jgi:hypothetical protein
MEPMDRHDLAEYFDRTKAQSQRALVKLGHFSSRLFPSAGEAASEGTSDAAAEHEHAAEEPAA